MDISQKELSRIVCFRNPHAGILLDNGGANGRRYFLADQWGVLQTGETSIHRIAALHVSAKTVVDFLNHIEERIKQTTIRKENQEDDPSSMSEIQALPSLLSQNKSGATALHVAIHRNPMKLDAIVRAFLERCPKLASTPMHCGSYPLHILTGHSVTINPTVLMTLLRADPDVTTIEDCNGDTPLSLLWKSVLRFRWARYWEMKDIVPIYKPGDLSWMTVIAPDQFRNFSLHLIRASFPRGRILSWHDICRHPRCPPLLVRILLNDANKTEPTLSLSDLDDEGRLPLHCAAEAPFVATDFLPESMTASFQTTLEVVLEAEPRAALEKDSFGRLPLHYALANPTLTNDHLSSISFLVQAFPDSLTIQDPLTGLYPAMQLAAHPCCGPRGLQALYCVLRANPNVCHYHSPCPIPC